MKNTCYTLYTYEGSEFEGEVDAVVSCTEYPMPCTHVTKTKLIAYSAKR